MHSTNCILPSLSNLSPWKTRKDTLQDYDNFTYNPYQIFNSQIQRPIQQLHHQAKIKIIPKLLPKKRAQKDSQQKHRIFFSQEKKGNEEGENQVLIHMNQRISKGLSSQHNTPKNGLRSREKQRQYNSAFQQREQKKEQKRIHLGAISTNNNQNNHKQQMVVMKENKMTVIEKPPLENTLTVRMFQIENEQIPKSKSKTKKRVLELNNPNNDKENYNFLSMLSKNKQQNSISKIKSENRYHEMSNLLSIKQSYPKFSQWKPQGIEKQKQSISILRSYEKNYRILESESTINNVLRKTIDSNQFKFK